MSSLNEALNADLSKYKPVEPETRPFPPAVITALQPSLSRANPNLRCPLPPFGGDPDVLRQFDEFNPQAPKIRIIPLGASTKPAPPARPTSVEIKNSTTVVIPATAPAIKAVSVELNTGGLSAGESFVGSVQMQKSFQLLSITSDTPCEVRFYCTSAAQSFDNGRAEGAPVAPEVTSGIISCVTLDDVLAWGWAGRMGSNQDNPQTPTVYITVFNTTGVAVTNISISVNYLPLES